MADITSIRIDLNGTNYSIQDVGAREEITELKNSLTDGTLKMTYENSILKLMYGDVVISSFNISSAGGSSSANTNNIVGSAIVGSAIL